MVQSWHGGTGSSAETSWSEAVNGNRAPCEPPCVRQIPIELIRFSETSASGQLRVRRSPSPGRYMLLCKRVRAKRSHRVPNRPSLSLAKRDEIVIGARSPDWPALVFATTEHGEGWVPERHFTPDRPHAVTVTQYDTIGIVRCTTWRKYSYSKRLGRTFGCPAVRAVCAPFAVPGIVGEFNGASCATR